MKKADVGRKPSNDGSADKADVRRTAAPRGQLNDCFADEAAIQVPCSDGRIRPIADVRICCSEWQLRAHSGAVHGVADRVELCDVSYVGVWTSRDSLVLKALTPSRLRLWTHPDRTFVGRNTKVFVFLENHFFLRVWSALPKEHVAKMCETAARLYEQERREGSRVSKDRVRPMI